MTATIHRDATSAWNFLVKHGGIELQGRDEGLDVTICRRLDHTAPSLEYALARATMEAFTSAFFEAIEPYVGMFKDILHFFEKADATQGQDQWTLRVDDLDLDLEHFRQSIADWTKTAHSELMVPAVDFYGVWALLKKLLDRIPGDAVLEMTFKGKHLDLPADVLSWVKAFNADSYLPLPKSLTPAALPAGLSECATIALAGLERLRDLGLTPSQRKALSAARSSTGGLFGRVLLLDDLAQ